MANLDLILEYQNADKKNVDLQREIRSSKEYKNYANAQKVMKSKPAILDPMEVQAEKLENEYRALEKTIAELSETVDDFEGIEELVDESNIEFYSSNMASVSKSLSQARATLARLTDEIKNLDGSFKKERAATIDAQKAVRDTKKAYGEYQSTKAEAAKEIADELKKIEGKFTDAADKELLSRYKEKRKAGIYPVFTPVAVEGGTMRCLACGINLSMAETERLAKGDIKECENCGRIMYLKK